MQKSWIFALDAEPSEVAYSSIRTRTRAASLVGEGPTRWGIRAGRRMADQILRSVDDPETHRDPEEVETLRRATEASTLDTLAVIVTGDTSLLATSAEPKDNIAFYVSREIPLHEVVRMVHVGQEFLQHELLGAIEEFLAPELRFSIAQETTREVTAGWSWLVQNISELYTQELEIWRQSRVGRQRALISRILEHRPLDRTTTGDILGYDVDLFHRAMILWLDSVDLDLARSFDFERIAASVRERGFPKSSGLLVRPGQGNVELWFSGVHGDYLPPLTQGEWWPPYLRAAQGAVMKGIEGMRSSYEQAKDAQRLSGLDRQSQAIISYEGNELVSLLLSAPERARELVIRRLGPLAEDNIRAQELRETLRVSLDSQGSVSETAKTLHAHRNTISYRLHQIESMLPQGGSYLEIRSALELAERFPEQVLTGNH